MSPEGGVDFWFAGLNQLVELILVLHKRDELEIETVNAVSKAASGVFSKLLQGALVLKS